MSPPATSFRLGFGLGYRGTITTHPFGYGVVVGKARTWGVTNGSIRRREMLVVEQRASSRRRIGECVNNGRSQVTLPWPWWNLNDDDDDSARVFWMAMIFVAGRCLEAPRSRLASPVVVVWMLRVLPGVIFGDIVYHSKRRNDCVFVIKLAVIVYTEMQCVQDQPDPMRYGGVYL